MAEVVVSESRIGGVGVFTRTSVSAGECLRCLNLVREITSESPLRPEADEHAEHCTVVDGHLYLVGSPDRFLNHSCDPNAYLRFPTLTRIELVARRDIAAGSELTIDYLVNNAGGASWTCRCSALRCRGETGHSFFTLAPELQQEYFPLLASWFTARHAEELKSVMRAPSN